MKNKKENWTCQDVIDKDGYYRHNECGSILLRVNKNTNISNCYCYCKICRREIRIQDIVNGQIRPPKPNLKIHTNETA